MSGEEEKPIISKILERTTEDVAEGGGGNALDRMQNLVAERVKKLMEKRKKDLEEHGHIDRYDSTDNY